MTPQSLSVDIDHFSLFLILCKCYVFAKRPTSGEVGSRVGGSGTTPGKVAARIKY